MASLVEPRRWRRVGLPILVLRVLGQGSEFAAFVIFARRLGTTSFGHLSVAFLICRYAGLVADWGASVRGPRDVAATVNTGVLLALVRRRYLATAMLSAGYVTSVLLMGQTDLAPLVVTIVGRGVSRDWIALGHERGARSSVPPAMQGVAMLIGSVAVNTTGTAALCVAGAYAVAGIASIALNPLHGLSRDGKVAVDGWILVAVLADQVLATLDTILLAALRSPSEAGIYAAVYRLPNAWVTVLGLAVVGLVPTTTRALTGDPGRLGEMCKRALRTGALLGFVVLCTVPLAWSLVPRVFGDAYRAGQVPLAILLVGTAVTATGIPLHPILLALGRDQAQARITLLAAGLNLAANVFLIPLLGMSGAALTTLSSQLVLLGLFWRAVAQSIPRSGHDSGTQR